METIDLNKLSPQQLEQLKQQVAEKDKADKERVRTERETYKQLVDETVIDLFKGLQELSLTLVEEKAKVFTRFEQILEMKQGLFGIKADQQSHSFTTTDGKITIKIGHRVNEEYDDTVGEGIAKVKEYLKTLAKDDNSASLVETVMNLLRQDTKGNLKASRVLELEKLANKTGNESFLDGISIIKNSYRPVRSCQFVEVRFKDENNNEHALPLSMSAAE